jgi:glutathione synthase/RimK-type ligase-like ATP-grasp enzyme
MKKIAIYFSDPEPMGYPFNTTYPYWEIYQGIIKDIEKQGVDVYIVRGVSYLGKGTFSHGWQVKDGAMVSVNQPITVNLIFNRDDKNTIPAIYDCPIINHPELDRICVDKVETAKFFPEFSPKTKAINSYKEYVATMAEWSLDAENKIVLKKNFLSSGRGIFILPIKNITEPLYDNWQDILVQEFIDNSVGIPGIIEGLHDIRVTTINGEPVYTFIRTPAPGSYLANVAQGGTEIPLDIAKLPPNLLAVVAAINKKLAQYRPSIFASDFVNSKNGFKLLELNSRPGVCLPSLSVQDKQFNDKMAAMLVEALK